jgi:transposase
LFLKEKGVRVLAMDKDNVMSAPEITDIDFHELAKLIERVEQAIEHDLALSVSDMKLLLCAITTLCTLQTKMEQDDITLHKLRKLLGMIKQSEQRQSSDNKRKKTSTNKKNLAKKKAKKLAKTKTDHHVFPTDQRGSVCQECQRGKLYPYTAKRLLRITGHAPFEATQHIVEQWRCNACQALYTASLPDSVLEDGDADQQYGYSARALMAINKFYTGTPYYHQENLTDLFGFYISASTIFDQCETVANDSMPVFYELKRQAARAELFLLDDTYNRILEQQPELRDRPNGKGQQLRSGVYSSGLIALLPDGREIVLFETSLGHAGEHLDSILQHRPSNLLAPKIMSDALSSNKVTKTVVIVCYCNAHARRQFYDLEKLYPEELGWVLDTYGKIWGNEAIIQDQKMSDEKRLAYHQEHSLPAMTSIHAWVIKKLASEDFEEYSALGKAIKYFHKYYDGLIMFCVMLGAPIDNNRMEEKLKIVIRGRKTSHFYKTANGAGVANVIISLIATAAQADVNSYEYLIALQKNRKRVKENPKNWLPWNYEITLAEANVIEHLPAIEVVNSS